MLSLKKKITIQFEYDVHHWASAFSFNLKEKKLRKQFYFSLQIQVTANYRKIEIWRITFYSVFWVNEWCVSLHSFSYLSLGAVSLREVAEDCCLVMKCIDV